MVKSEYAIDYIKNKLLGLIHSGKLKATCNPSKSTVSFYVNDIETINRPLLTLTLRLSDHHPTLQHYVDSTTNLPSTESNTNISIEFYKPLYNKHRKKKRNKFNANVRTKDDTVVLPFTVTYFEYKPGLLDNADVETIYKSILQWIYNNDKDGSFIDPFKGTPKEAKTATKTANIKTDFTYYAVYRDSVRCNQNQQDGWGNSTQAEINWWKTKGIGDSIIRKGNIIENKQHKNNINMNKKRIRLTESDLHRIVNESVNNVMRDYATPITNEEKAFQKFIQNSNLSPIQCSKAGVDYDLWKNYQWCIMHCYGNGKNAQTINDPKPLENEIKNQFIANYRRLQKQGWIKEAFTYGKGISENKQYKNNTNMNKKRIKLTESDLHRIIKESVNKVLTELDWKTYANAAKKAREQASLDWENANFNDYDKNFTRARKFSNASADELDKQYGGRHSVYTDEPEFQRFTRYPDSEIDVSHFAERPLDGNEKDWPPYASTTHDEYHPGNKEMSDFVKGNYEYQKDKGWKLKN